MDTSALFHDDNNESENYHVGDLNVGEHLITDDISDIVLTVGELVEMYNSEDPLVNTDSDVEVINPDVTGKKRFERLQTNPSSKQTQSEITVDFRDVAGRIEEAYSLSDTYFQMRGRRRSAWRRWCWRKRQSGTGRSSATTGRGQLSNKYSTSQGWDKILLFLGTPGLNQRFCLKHLTSRLLNG